ncbi:MAG: hypothetical protein KBC81_01615 [Candidatus Pacebacteria bacterium]|nr:hypothetical protein [Candidatus Paceibacterota bacterium]
MKKPFLNALGAAVYIVAIIFIVQGAGLLFKNETGTILIPMVMLSMFVLSAAIMGFLFLAEPLQLLMESKKKEAIAFFAKTVAFFACFLILFAIFLFFNSAVIPR